MRLVVVIVLLGFHAISVDVKTSADLILVNANIRTMDSSVRRAEALAVRDGRIIAIGSTPDIRKLANDNTQVIDAGGRLVIPGFNDAHVHFTAIGNQFSHLDLRQVREARAVLDRIAFYASVLPKDRWLLGGGLSVLPTDLPTLAQLDEVS